MKLNLGCGYDYKEGWINVDAYTPQYVDVFDYVETLRKFKRMTVDHIYAAHVLEHLSQKDARKAVRRWYNLLKIDGIVEIIVPNIPVIIEKWIHVYRMNYPNLWGKTSQMIWGDQAHEGEFHRWGYDAPSLRYILEKAGFTEIDITLEPGIGDNEMIKDGNIHAIARRSP